MTIRHQYTPVLTVLTDDDGTNPRFGGLVLADSYSESCRIEDESIEDLTGAYEAPATAWLDERANRLISAVVQSLVDREPEPPLPTMATMVAEAVQDMIDLPEGLSHDELRQALNEVCEQPVPSMATTLAMMIVADNALGWIDVDSGLSADEHGDVNALHTLEVGLVERIKDQVTAHFTDEGSLEENRTQLRQLSDAFDANGGRGVALADELDRVGRLVELGEALG